MQRHVEDAEAKHAECAAMCICLYAVAMIGVGLATLVRWVL